MDEGLEILFTGQEFRKDTVSVADVARMLETLHEMIAAQAGLMADGEGGSAVGFGEIRQGSLDFSFTGQQPVVRRAYEQIVRAINRRDFNVLSDKTLEGLRATQRFSRRHGGYAELRISDALDVRAVLEPSLEIRAEKVEMQGDSSLIGELVRVGGDNPPRAVLKMADGSTLSCRVRGKKLAQTLAGRLYETVQVTGRARWNVRDGMRVTEFMISRIAPYKQPATIMAAVDELIAAMSPYYADVTDAAAYRRELRGEEQE